ncbi:hypothetical protein [Thermoflavimicrobium dichotomicum]|uniref:Zinc-finger n=1 Tax=Thermoflavimicrobium dichotomicum TaxID=46223 RepID=A0A1I3T0P4_9BACL|nr:hypothetical protein [Thermoflavimicrobium dichotomicum]SFJ63127.1 hypothetical protein SAMN05421852_11490 [Thermoflavimicrobium dichotomicum]
MIHKCTDIQSLLPWLVNGSLDSCQKVEIFSHLTTCTDCIQDFAFFIQLQQSAQRFDIQPSTDFKNELLQAIVKQIETDQEKCLNAFPSIFHLILENPSPLLIFQTIVSLIMEKHVQALNPLLKDHGL